MEPLGTCQEHVQARRFCRGGSVFKPRMPPPLYSPFTRLTQVSPLHECANDANALGDVILPSQRPSTFATTVLEAHSPRRTNATYLPVWQLQLRRWWIWMLPCGLLHRARGEPEPDVPQLSSRISEPCHLVSIPLDILP